MNLEIKQLSKNDEKKWDEFVMENNDTTFYHQMGWNKVVEETYGHKSFYLFAENDEGNVVGILPMFLIKDIFFGKRFVSMPFAPYGGVCGEDENIRNALTSEAMNLTRSIGADYCEFKNYQNASAHENINCISNYSTFLLDLSVGVEYIWNNMNRKVRNMIRKGEKNNLIFEVNAIRDTNSEFYKIYLRNMKKLGTPVHHPMFFKNIARIFADDVLISEVLLNGQIISSLFLLQFKNTLISGWGASLPEFLEYAPNDFLYWNSIKYACENDISYFDFGRSLIYSGNYKFKKRWGPTEVPLTYCYYPSTKIPPPPQNKYGQFAKVWSKLPFKVAAVIGPRVRKYIV